ncbi:MAG: hypothetical protein KatS3mg065_0205 [Chloroflexota bacterium]|nr:MAG: hypothetical protein KatS3mg065_0205 [Chloroflexota bacterium]
MRRFRDSRRWPALLLAGGVLAGCSGFAVAGSPWTAGEPSTRQLAIDRVATTAAGARADVLRAKLGLPGRVVAVERIEDRFENRVVDRVTFEDEIGPSALVELEPNGRPHLVIALGWRGAKGVAVGRNVALRLAIAQARAAGFQVAGAPTILETAEEWEVVWERRVDGIPVLGDGVRVSLWKDGSFHAIVHWEHDLAPRPATIIDAARAREIAVARFAERFGRRDAIAIRSASLAWVRPNDLWDPSRPDAPTPEARLAWLVSGVPGDPDAVTPHQIELWLDAADGSVIGGDLIE